MRDYFDVIEEITKIFKERDLSLTQVLEIRLPKSDYKNFLTETKELGYSVTWWGLPVVSHDLDQIYLVMK